MEIIGTKVRLREKSLSDARNDYLWQSDPEIARLDAAPQLTISLPEYLVDYSYHLRSAVSLRHPFAVDTLDGKHIGNCTYYNVKESEGEAELGIMIGDRDYWGMGYGTDAVTSLVKHVFLNTSLRRLHLKTLDWNIRAQKCFKKCGFKPCGQLSQNGNSFVVMELFRDQWQEQQDSREVCQDE